MKEDNWDGLRYFLMDEMREALRRAYGKGSLTAVDMQKLKQTYVYNSAPFELKHMEIFNTFNDAVAQIREESKTQIQDVIQKVRDKVSEIITSPLPNSLFISVLVYEY